MTPTIYVDIDETVSHFIRPFIAFARKHDTTLPDYKDWSDTRGGLSPGEFATLLHKYENAHGYQNQSCDKEARDSLWELFRSGHPISYITLRSPAFWRATMHWIVDKGLPMGEVITLGPGADKALVIDGDHDALVWIDDQVPKVLPKSCELVLVPRPWNAESTLRRMTWKAIVSEFSKGE